MKSDIEELYEIALLRKKMVEWLEDMQTVHGIKTIEEVYERLNDDAARAFKELTIKDSRKDDDNDIKFPFIYEDKEQYNPFPEVTYEPANRKSTKKKVK